MFEAKELKVEEVLDIIPLADTAMVRLKDGRYAFGIGIGVEGLKFRQESDYGDAAEIYSTYDEMLTAFAKYKEDYPHFFKTNGCGEPINAESFLVLDSPAISFWLKKAIKDLEERDPVDAVKDAELLGRIAKLRLQKTFAKGE